MRPVVIFLLGLPLFTFNVRRGRVILLSRGNPRLDSFRGIQLGRINRNHAVRFLAPFSNAVRVVQMVLDKDFGLVRTHVAFLVVGLVLLQRFWRLEPCVAT